MKLKLVTTLSRTRVLTVVTAVVAVAAIGTAVAADLGEGNGGPSPAPPGTPESGQSALPTESPLPIEEITTGGTNYDPTILTKFISGRGFITNQGPDGVDDDRILFNGSTCVSPTAGPMGGSITDLFAPVELPDGARIKQVVFFGTDTSASDITITLWRNETNEPPSPGSPTRTETTVTSFTTTGTPGVVALASVDNLDEVTGDFSPSATVGFNHRFHVLDVNMINATTTAQVLCGVEVRYQVPVSAADPGAVFHPITPVRAYDSRISAYPVNGFIPNNSSRVVDISSGHDLSTGAVTLANAVPAGATAITYNLTTDQSTTVGFVAITPGNATSFAASAINLNGTPLANGGTVQIAGDRTIKVWVGGGGTTQVIVDVTGYYTGPVASPNMAG